MTVARHPDSKDAYRDDNELSELGPFTVGNMHEVSTDMTRIYDRNGWPIIEVWASQAMAEHIAAVLNAASGQDI